ncbi:N-acyl-D-amino-acid deacylase family protein [Dactylosporangium matsuzakiense]|uniref:N-acyl-D-amino-acid deacylase n=1 Tax=Dactylosporangium matsuzakiense TaxID=53360 RepID=A0A9W6NL57_9ACTN|nr:D-aminoacylase [Dactylosporangium matsuzakiense]UWZ42544.1 D-aminoacylase [Dactylosporangium matsuzakiense]GLL00537.1 N-acyl-D-amino-acid deacylase [Dactylosporangium matsuzakiense]
MLIQGGTVLDGTGAAGTLADVLIRGGRIAAIGPDLRADATTFDASGRIVCPGFVDLHTHSDLTLLSGPQARSKVHQGVTTEVVGNCGLGVAPLPAGADRDGIRLAVSYLDLDPAIAWSWTDLPGYLAALTAARPSVNVAALVGHVPLHAGVCGFDDRPATPAELERMCGLLADALGAGALGLSTGLVYPPLTYAREEELVALARVVAAAGAVFTWHVRSYDDGLLDSVAQAVRVARAAGCRTQISHLAAVGRRNWGAVRGALDLVDAANADGIEVGVDIYPYVHGNAPLSQLLPAWALEGGAAAWAPRLRDPAVRARVKAAWVDRPTGWDELTVSWTSRGDGDPVVGRTLEDLGGADATLDLLAELGAGAMMTAGGRSEDDLRTVLAHPAAVVASDGLALDPGGVTGAGVPHPRSYGCFPRYLHRYATDLPDAVRRCTSEPARRIGLAHLGVLRPGAPADVVVFDPATIADTATFTAPHQLATGIDLVLVGGVPTVHGGRHTGRRAGRVLHRTRGATG